MEVIKKHLGKAYEYISKLKVNGDSVDIVALARAELRKAYEEAENVQKKKEAQADAAEEDAPRQREPEGGTGTV